MKKYMVRIGHDSAPIEAPNQQMAAATFFQWSGIRSSKHEVEISEIADKDAAVVARYAEDGIEILHGSINDVDAPAEPVKQEVDANEIVRSLNETRNELNASRQLNEQLLARLEELENRIDNPTSPETVEDEDEDEE